MTEKKAQKYVVTHTAVGPHAEGDVIEADRLVTRHPSGDYDAAPKLLARGAIRPATDDEAARPRVEVVAPGVVMTPAVAALLGNKDAEIERLRRLVGSQTDKLGSHERLGTLPAPVAAEDHPQVQALVKEKDAEIEALTKKAEENQARLAEAEKAVAEKAQAAQDYSVTGPTAETAPKHGRAQHKRSE